MRDADTPGPIDLAAIERRLEAAEDAVAFADNAGMVVTDDERAIQELHDALVAANVDLRRLLAEVRAL